MAQEREHGQDSAAQDRVNGWIARSGRHVADARRFFDGLAEMWRLAGVPVDRLMFSLRTIHPQVAATSFLWQHGAATVEISRDHRIGDSVEYLQSPFRPLHQGTDFIRGRLAGPDGARDFPIYDDLRAEGYTDYAAFAVLFSDGARNVLSMTTRDAAGFTEAHLALVRDSLPMAAMVLEIHAGRRIAEAVVDTYVGRQAGRRILAGEIRRGQGERINAVVLFADMRGFSALSDLRPTDEVIATLNGFFDALVPAIEAHRGDVLKFMGDGVLAIFPIDDAAFRHFACREALQAALDAHAAVAAFNARRAAAGAPPVRFGVALHVGVVVYGNVGSANRLDFTCIGPAVNLTARLQTVAARLDARIVMSEAFANVVREYRPVASLGHHPVKGMLAAPQVFTLADMAPPRAVAA